MSDYNLKITVRNNRILKAIKNAGYKTQAAFARSIGMSYTNLNNIVAMRQPPVNSNGRLCAIAQQLCDELCLLPEDLWTDEQLFAKVPRNTIEVEISTDDAIRLSDNRDYLRQIISGAHLAEREQNILALRFFKDLTLEETAEELGVSGERARQLEGKALRNIRQYSRLIN